MLLASYTFPFSALGGKWKHFQHSHYLKNRKWLWPHLMIITLTCFLCTALSEKRSSQDKDGQGLGLSRLDEISQHWAQGKNNLPGASVRLPMQHFFSCVWWAWKRLEILPCKLAIAQLTRQLNQQSNQLMLTCLNLSESSGSMEIRVYPSPWGNFQTH